MSKDRRKRRLPTVARPTPATLPTQPAPDPATTIVVGGSTRRGDRKLAKQRKRRKRGLVGVAALTVIGLLVAAGVIAFATHQKKTAATGPARTQRTLLLQITGSTGSAVEAALLAHDPKKKTGAIVLLPSRVIAEVPGRGSAPFGDALALGGPRVAEEALADLMGVIVDGSWVLTRPAFAALVDRLGGVDVDVDTDILGAAAGGFRVVIVSAGHQHLAGTAAVAFATYLAGGEAELARLPRLQEVLDGIAAAAKVKGVTAVTAAVKGLGTGARLSRSPADVATLLVGLADDDLTEDTLPVRDIDTGGPTAYGIDPTGLRTLVDAALADSVPASARATNNRVLVQNGVGRPGIGESVRRRLDKAGFLYRPGGNVPGFTFQHSPSVVLIKDGTQASIELGQKVARALGLPVSAVRTSTEGQSVADVIVIIGADYKP